MPQEEEILLPPPPKKNSAPTMAADGVALPPPPKKKNTGDTTTTSSKEVQFGSETVFPYLENGSEKTLASSSTSSSKSTSGSENRAKNSFKAQTSGDASVSPQVPKIVSPKMETYDKAINNVTDRLTQATEQFKQHNEALQAHAVQIEQMKHDPEAYNAEVKKFNADLDANGNMLNQIKADEAKLNILNAGKENVIKRDDPSYGEYWSRVGAPMLGSFIASIPVEGARVMGAMGMMNAGVPIELALQTTNDQIKQNPVLNSLEQFSQIKQAQAAKTSEDLAKREHATFTEAYDKGDYLKAAELALKSGIASAPLSIALGATAVTGIGSLGAITTYLGTAGMKNAELRDRTDMSAEDKQLNAIGNGAFEAAFEFVPDALGAHIVKGLVKQVGKDKAQQAIKKTLAQSFYDIYKKSFLITQPTAEGLGEVFTGISQRATDLYTDPQLSKLSDEEKKEYVFGKNFSKLKEEFAAGAAGASIFVGPAAVIKGYSALSNLKQNAKLSEVLTKKQAIEKDLQDGKLKGDAAGIAHTEMENLTEDANKLVQQDVESTEHLTTDQKAEVQNIQNALGSVNDGLNTDGISDQTKNTLEKKKVELETQLDEILKTPVESTEPAHENAAPSGHPSILNNDLQKLFGKKKGAEEYEKVKISNPILEEHLSKSGKLNVEYGDPEKDNKNPDVLFWAKESPNGQHRIFINNNIRTPGFKPKFKVWGADPELVKQLKEQKLTKDEFERLLMYVAAESFNKKQDGKAPEINAEVVDKAITQVLKEKKSGLYLDINGEPLIFMHGGRKGIKDFKTPQDKDYKGSGDPLTGQEGIYFSRDVDQADKYGGFKGENKTDPSKDIYYAFLNIKRPYEVGNPSHENIYKLPSSETITSADRKELEKHGFDGVIWDKEGKPKHEVIVFDPSQVKTIGTYSGETNTPTEKPKTKHDQISDLKTELTDLEKQKRGAPIRGKKGILSQKQVRARIQNVKAQLRDVKGVETRKKNDNTSALDQIDPQTPQDFIALKLAGIRVDSKSFADQMGKAFVEGSIRINYLSSSSGVPLSSIASDLINEGGIFENTDEADLMQMIADFMLLYPGGPNSYAKKMLEGAQTDNQQEDDKELIDYVDWLASKQEEQEREEYYDEVGAAWQNFEEYIDSLSDEEIDALHKNLDDNTLNNLIFESDDQFDQPTEEAANTAQGQEENSPGSVQPEASGEEHPDTRGRANRRKAESEWKSSVADAEERLKNVKKQRDNQFNKLSSRADLFEGDIKASDQLFSTKQDQSPEGIKRAMEPWENRVKAIEAELQDLRDNKEAYLSGNKNQSDLFLPPTVEEEKTALEKRIEQKIADIKKTWDSYKNLGIMPPKPDIKEDFKFIMDLAELAILKGVKTAVDLAHLVGFNLNRLIEKAFEKRNEIADGTYTEQELTTDFPDRYSTPSQMSREKIKQALDSGTDKKESPWIRIKKLIGNLSHYIDNPNRYITELEQNVMSLYNYKRPGNIPLGRIAEQNHSGKAKSAVMDFADAVVKGLSLEQISLFNEYLFSKRIIDRNAQNLVNNMNPDNLSADRSTGNISAADAQTALHLLKDDIGQELYDDFEERGNHFQIEMNKVLKRLVESGRLSQEQYDAIKDQNEFYAPFNVVQTLSRPDEDPTKAASAGNVVKRIKGIGYKPQMNNFDLRLIEGAFSKGQISAEDYYGASIDILDTMLNNGTIDEVEYNKEIAAMISPGFSVTNILDKAAQIIYKSVLLAERNKFLHRVANLAAIDTSQAFFKPVDGFKFVNGTNIPMPVSEIKAPEGFAAFQYYNDGKARFLGVEKDVADTLNGLNEVQLSAVHKVINAINAIARFGIITLSPSFMYANAVIDLHRTLAISKYGLLAGTKITDQILNTIIIPLQLTEALIEGLTANFTGFKMPNYKDFMESPAYSSGMYDDVFRGEEKELKLKPKTNKELSAHVVKYIFTIPEMLGRSIEQAQKLFAQQRGFDVEGIKRTGVTKFVKETLLKYDVHNKTGTGLANAIDNAAYEIQNFAGSPNFPATSGAAKYMSTFFQFFSARLKGEATDLRRVMNYEGLSESQYKKFLLQLTMTTILPMVYLAYKNMADDDDEAEYDTIPSYDRNQNILIPTGTTFEYLNKDNIKETHGEYVKIPQRGVSASINTAVNSFMKYMKHKDSANFKKAALQVASNITPLTMSGDNSREMLESIAAAATPLPKYMYEEAANRDAFRHRDIISESGGRKGMMQRYLDGNLKPYEVVDRYGKTPEWSINLSKQLYEAGISITPIEIDHFENVFLGDISKLGNDNVVSGRILRSHSKYPVYQEK